MGPAEPGQSGQTIELSPFTAWVGIDAQGIRPFITLVKDDESLSEWIITQITTLRLHERRGGSLTPMRWAYSCHV